MTDTRAMMLVGTLFSILALIAVLGMRQVVLEDRKQNKFMRACIEFRTTERCRLLYQYDRPDLMYHSNPKE